MGVGISVVAPDQRLCTFRKDNEIGVDEIRTQVNRANQIRICTLQERVVNIPRGNRCQPSDELYVAGFFLLNAHDRVSGSQGDWLRCHPEGRLVRL